MTLCGPNTRNRARLERLAGATVGSDGCEVVPNQQENKLGFSPCWNGYHVLRFLCEDVGKRLDEVLEAIIRALSHRCTQQSREVELAKMEQFDRITTNLNRMNGEPCIRDLRLTVRRVLEALAVYPDRNELKREYPELEDEDIRQALAFAAALVDDKIFPLPQTR